MFYHLNLEIQNTDELNNQSKAMIGNYATGYPPMLDNLILVMLILSWIFTIVFSFMIDSHPVFFIISVVALLLLLAMAGIIGNTYEEFIADQDISVITDRMPMTTWIFSHLIIIIMIISFTIGLSIYAKLRIAQ
jgi:hypothetical protein